MLGLEDDDSSMPRRVPRLLLVRAPTRLFLVMSTALLEAADVRLRKLPMRLFNAGGLFEVMTLSFRFSSGAGALDAAHGSQLITSGLATQRRLRAS
jgi:hypothetical protein